MIYTINIQTTSNINQITVFDTTQIGKIVSFFFFRLEAKLVKTVMLRENTIIVINGNSF